MQTTPEIALSRIKKRNRIEETEINLNFITNLHNLYEDWLIFSKFPIPAPVLILNANTNIESMENDFEKVIQFILSSKK